LQALLSQFIRFKRGIQGSKQIALAEWFQQTLYSATFKHPWTDVAVAMCRHKNYRDPVVSPDQFTMQGGPAHSWHGDVKDQTFGSGNEIGGQELFCRRKSLDCKSAFS
jgi:hypothetical protein